MTKRPVASADHLASWPAPWAALPPPSSRIPTSWCLSLRCRVGRTTKSTTLDERTALRLRVHPEGSVRASSLAATGRDELHWEPCDLRGVVKPYLSPAQLKERAFVHRSVEDPGAETQRLGCRWRPSSGCCAGVEETVASSAGPASASCEPLQPEQKPCGFGGCSQNGGRLDLMEVKVQ